MQFQVPQFIETEDKVIGPLTLKQFGYLAAAGALSVIFFLLLKLWLWILLTTICGGIAVMFAFVPINGRPMTTFIRALFDNLWRPKVYIFKTGASSEGFTPEVSLPKGLIKKQTSFAPLRAAVPSFEGVKGLWQRLSTSRTAIPRRERPLTQDWSAPQRNFKDRYEVIRKITGDREVARRVDYR